MDEIIRKAIFHLTEKGEVTWRSFEGVGGSSGYYEWYYAENQQYIIHDVMVDGYYFITARSPKEAFKILMARWDEAMKAGQSCEEEEDW